jgi:hypothetical protein
MVKVTFVAKEQGFYKVVFSNSHSWYRPKTLKYRFIVLKPFQMAATVLAEKGFNLSLNG